MDKYRSPYKNLERDQVCKLKLRFSTYKDTHNYIREKKLIGQAPYKCDNIRNNDTHHHITTSKKAVEEYKLWIEKLIDDFRTGKGSNRTRNPETRSRIRKRWKKRQTAKKLESRLNYGIDHQFIMDEIELGF